MSDYLKRLVERSLGVGEVVQPRLGSLFEPRGAVAPPPFVEESVEVAVERAAPAAVLPPEPVAEPSPPGPQSEEARPSPSPAPPPAQPPPQVVVIRESPAEPTEQAAPSERVAEPAPPAAAPLPPVVVPRQPTSRQQEQPTTRTVVVHSREHAVTRPEPASERETGSAPQPHGESWLEPPPAPVRVVVPAWSPPAAAEPPVVRVTIGRVDVRAVLPPAPPQRAAPTRARRMSLDEYLREGGRR